jgi:hypothetical protein
MPGPTQEPQTVSRPYTALDAYRDNEPTNLAKGPLDSADLGRKSGGTLVNSLDPNVCPVWRLRIVADGQTSYVRLDTNSANGDELAPASFGPEDKPIAPANTPRVPADGWLCLRPTADSPFVTVDPAALSAKFTSIRVPGMAGTAGVNRNATIYLERLTDPSARVQRGDPAWTLNPTTDPSTLTTAQLTGMPIYRVVDQTTVQVVNRIPVAPEWFTGVASCPPAGFSQSAQGIHQAVAGPGCGR